MDKVPVFDSVDRSALDSQTQISCLEQDILRYEEKIRRLEENIYSLRISRRVVMSMLEALQQDHAQQQQRWQDERGRMQRRSVALAKRLLQANTRLQDLEEKSGRGGII
ncbi:MAG: hypothetical protein Q4B96_00815 [Bacillota bacterium]|nr:hypothetical protein [Bacillota bacterium]